MRALDWLRMGRLCARSSLMWIAAWHEGHTGTTRPRLSVRGYTMTVGTQCHMYSRSPRRLRRDMYEQRPGVPLELASFIISLTCVRS